ncbi:hypothetical protein V1524DRAFT_412068 [Lipomyces starkeyi]
MAEHVSAVPFLSTGAIRIVDESTNFVRSGQAINKPIDPVVTTRSPPESKQSEEDIVQALLSLDQGPKVISPRGIPTRLSGERNADDRSDNIPLSAIQDQSVEGTINLGPTTRNTRPNVTPSTTNTETTPAGATFTETTLKTSRESNGGADTDVGATVKPIPSVDYASPFGARRDSISISPNDFTSQCVDVAGLGASPQSCLSTEIITDGLDLFSESSFSCFSRYHDLHDTLRNYMFASARSLTSTRASTSRLGPPVTGSSGNAMQSMTQTPPVIEPGEHLQNLETTRLFKNYIDEVAGWLDMFDSERHFGTTIASLSIYCPALFYSLLAISSRQLERIDPHHPSPLSLKLYQQSITYIVPNFEARDLKIIAACVVLCCLEMMSSAPQNWRRHLEGCAAMFSSAGINGFCGDLGQALFWCFARMDLSSAVIGEESTIINVKDWIPAGVHLHDVGSFFRAAKTNDMYANYVVFLCSRVMHLISGDGNNDDTMSYDRDWEDLWKDLCEWERLRPLDMVPLLSYEAVENAPFPTVLYGNAPAISGNQLYHMASILLMQNKPRQFKFPQGTASMLWHAKQICAISITNTHHGCWNHALQPLWVAGKLMSHRSEHDAILDILLRIEKITGWAMKWRGEDLKEYWGFH